MDLFTRGLPKTVFRLVCAQGFRFSQVHLKRNNLKMKEISSKADFDKEIVAAGDRAVIVDFHATWCGPCKMIAPTLKTLAEQYPTIVVLKVDVDDVDEVAADYKVTAMPTFLVLKNRQEAERITGANKEKLTDIFAKYK